MVFTTTGGYVQRFQEIVDALADEIGRSTVVSDTSMRPIVATVQRDGVDEARVRSILERRPPEAAVDYVRGLDALDSRVPIEVPASEPQGFLRRLLIPFWLNDTCLGFMWLILGANDLTDAERTAIAHAETAILEAYVGSLADSDAELAQVQDWILGGLIDPDESRRARAAQLFEAALVGRDVRGLHIGVLLAEKRLADVATLATALRQATGDRALVHVLAPDAAVALFRLPGSLDGFVPAKHAMGAAEIGDLTRTRQAFAEARFAALVAATEPRSPRARLFSQLGTWQLLRDRSADVASLRLLCPEIDIVLASGAEVLRETLETFLDAGGDVARTVDELHVHRTTFYYRMGRLRELMGSVLDDGWARAGLHAALRLLRLAATRTRYLDSER